MYDIYFQDHTTKSPWTKTCQFLPTSRKIVQFSEGKEPKAGDRIVYIAGAFDLFRILLPDKASGAAHLNMLQTCIVHTSQGLVMRVSGVT